MANLSNAYLESITLIVRITGILVVHGLIQQRLQLGLIKILYVWL